jgi:hypothetical protein
VFHRFRVVRAMKNVTVSLEDEVAKWARVYAAEQNTSVSKLLGALLKERMRREQGYEKARSRFMSRRPAILREPGEGLPRRDELHDRSSFR